MAEISDSGVTIKAFFDKRTSSVIGAPVKVLGIETKL